MKAMETICYCWNHTDADIIEDVLKHRGVSTIEQKITDSKKTGACRCETLNPKKR